MYRRTLFLETLHRIREEMSREADYDVDLFAEMVRAGAYSEIKKKEPAKRKKKIVSVVKTKK